MKRVHVYITEVVKPVMRTTAEQVLWPRQQNNHSTVYDTIQYRILTDGQLNLPHRIITRNK